MAQIDIKNCNVYLVDGYSGPTGSGLVNNSGGYAGGATTMTVDGWTGAIVTGDRFQVAGDTSNGIYTVTGHTESGGNTTSITFTPALGHSVADDAAITVLPHSLKIRIGDGNVSWTEKRPVTYVKDRGLLDTVRLGDQEPVEVKFDATWVFLTASNTETAPTIEDALKNRNLASSWISSSTDPCEPYSLNIVIVYVPPCATPGETYIISDFRYEEIGHDLKQGQLAMSGKCNTIEASSVRTSTYAI